MQALSEGTRLADRYTLIRRQGEGGMSQVWLARDERADTTGVLKFLKESLATQTAYRELFHNEWRIGSRLMHAHIARVFEYYDDPDAPYFSLQYIDGPEIAVLANDDLANALRPFGLLADALRYAHGKSFVHRDIKASNVLLDQRGAPYLLDFGVAAADSGGSAVNASPGQRAGRQPEPADDVYALGVLMHEIITGRPPGDDVTSAPWSRPNGDPVPPDLQRLVGQMLSVDSASRPAAGDIADRLAKVGIETGPARLPSRAAAASVGIEPATVTVESIRPMPRSAADSSDTRTASTPRSGVSPRLVYAGLGVLLLLFFVVIFVLPGAVDPGSSDTDRAVVEELPERDGGADEEAPTAAPTSPGDVDTTSVADDVRPASGVDGGSAGFSENLGRTSADDAVRVKLATDEALGDLLSQLERLKYRGVERWGGQPYLDALDVYAEGDQAYLSKNYPTAGERYRQASAMLEPFFDRIDDEFRKSLAAAKEAFENLDFVEAIRLYDLAVAITPGDQEAERGLRRARNLEAVLGLMEQGQQFRAEIELAAAQLAFEKALALDPEWEPAKAALAAVALEIKELSFQMRMTEGLEALAGSDYESARAAFEAAKGIDPQSREPIDGLLQVDQEVRLFRIREMETEAQVQEESEQWEAAVATYQALLEVDGDLQFAQEGLSRSNARAAVHRRLQDYIDEPDSLSAPGTMQQATQMLLDVSRMNPMGPRLEDQRDELSRLLKRAATPLTVRFVSDNETEVSVYRVGKLGSFTTRDLDLRPGSYVAIGVRNGCRDVRVEFRVAPEIEQQPIVVRCEEPI